MQKLENLVSRRLLNLKVFKTQTQSPFTWANGWKSPIYFDDKKILSYPKERDFFKLEISRVIAEQYPEADVIAAVATNAIAQGVLVAHQLGLPFVYVYPQPKDHGLENQIEGDIRPGQKVVVLENQVNLGLHVMQVVEALELGGCEVLGVVTILDFEIPGTKEKFEEAGISLTAMTHFSTVVKMAKEEGRISEEEAKQVQQWHQQPEKWYQGKVSPSTGSKRKKSVLIQE